MIRAKLKNMDRVLTHFTDERERLSHCEIELSSDNSKIGVLRASQTHTDQFFQSSGGNTPKRLAISFSSGVFGVVVVNLF